jgi:DNA repair exonuclease SbcCD ATPase subunit
MQSRYLRSIALLVAAVFLIGIFVADADAQRRRRRRGRPATPRPVVTNPEIASPGSEQDPNGDTEKIISTAEDAATNAGESTSSKKPRSTDSSDPTMQQTLKNLSDHVDRLNQRLNQMQENDRSLLDMERLTRAEQRAESLRTQQLDVETKLADAQSKLEQVEFSIKPENIDRAAAGYGSTRPEEAREARRRQLESERTRLQAQIRILETSRTRLEQAVATADGEVDTLRRRLEQRQTDPGAVTTATEQRTETRPRPE